MTIGVDLDGTLAYWDESMGTDPVTTAIGDPIPSMLANVFKWIDEGHTVKIFTARACNADAIPKIKEWLHKQGLNLEITCCKEPCMEVYYDDRAITVERNTGNVLALS